MKTQKLALLAIVALTARGNASPEVCGNGLDDDGNGMEDDGCYPTMTTGVCESPLSCGDTGMVSWSSGALHYDLPPDVAPRVPFGPGIGMRRFYTSMPVTTKNTAINAQPMGPGWGHTYLTFLRATSAGGVFYISLHTSQGRDVLFSANEVHGPYTAQKTDHYLSLTFDSVNNIYLLQLLTGETLKYNGSGQLIEIWDTLGPTPNKVLVTWDSTTNGNVSTVTDASGKRRLLRLVEHADRETTLHILRGAPAAGDHQSRRHFEVHGAGLRHRWQAD